MSDIVLAQTVAEARYWTLKALQYWHVANSEKPVIYSDAYTQTRAMTIYVREIEGNNEYPNSSKVRFTAFEGVFGRNRYKVVCEQHYMRAPDADMPGWYIASIIGTVDINFIPEGDSILKELNFQASQFKDLGLEQPPRRTHR